MKKIKFFLIILCLKAHPVFSQLNSIFIDSVLIRINYTNSNDSIIKFEYSIYNLSNSSIYVAGELKNDLVKVGGIFEIQNGSCDFTIGYNDPTFNLVSDSDLYMLEIPSRRKWESDTLELHSSSSFKTLNFYYVSQSDENRLTHEKGQKKMPVRKYQACRRFLKLGFEQ